MPNIGLVDQQRFLGQFGPFLEIDFSFQLLDNRIHFCIRVTGKVICTVGTLAPRADQFLQRVQRIKSRHTPAVKIHAGIAVLDLGEVAGLGHRIELDPDADFGQHGGNRRADFFVILVAVIRAVESDIEAIAVTRLCHQFFGLVDVNGRALFKVLRIAANLRRNHRHGRQRKSAHDRLVDRRNVNGQQHGLAHTQILEGIFALASVKQLVAPLIEVHEDGAVFIALDNL